jgi:glucose/arabinose dehydrogenase
MRALLSIVVLLAVTPSVALAQGADQTVGQRFEVTVEDLPKPFASRSSSNSARIVGRPSGKLLNVPEGFRVNLFARDLSHARWMALAPGGDVFLIEPRAHRVTVLRDADGDGEAEKRWIFSNDISDPQGIAFAHGNLYVADQRRLWRFPYDQGQTRAYGRPQPLGGARALGRGGGHRTRNIAIHPNGREILIAVGSRANIAREEPPRATVQRIELMSTRAQTFASGLRNPVGIAFYPETEDLYVVVNERDGMGDGLVPDFLTRVRPGEFFGWPYAYLGPNPDPKLGNADRDLVARTVVPDVLFQAHSAPLGLVFYDAEAFPEEYRGDAFVALHGSWNASVPTGYKVVRVPFEEGRPKGHYENFATGFWLSGTQSARVFGRPAGLLVAGDGSLLIADDVGQAIWRVSYIGKKE